MSLSLVFVKDWIDWKRAASLEVRKEAGFQTGGVLSATVLPQFPDLLNHKSPMAAAEGVMIIM